MPGYFTTTHELIAAVALVIQGGSAVIVAVLLAPRLARPTLIDRLLVGVLLALTGPIGISLVAGMLGVLRLPVVVAAEIIAAAAVAIWCQRHPRPVDDDAPAKRRPGLLDASAIGATAAYVAISLFYSLRTQPSHDFDTSEYHINNLSWWLQRASIWHLPYAGPGSFTATHPSNGELLGVWIALSSHSDELIYVMPLLFAVLAIAACAVIARELSQDDRLAAVGVLAAVAVLTAPVAFFSQTDSLSTDLPAAAGLLTALALLLVARRQPETRTVVLAGVALGLGLGSKYTAFIPGALVALGAIVLLRRQRAWWWLVPGAALFAGPWFLRNLLDTGNPLFPQSLGPLAGSNTPYNLLATPILSQMAHGHTAIVHSWLKLVIRLVGPVLVFIIAGCLLALRSRRDRTAVVVSLLITAGATIGYLATPYTGGGLTGLAFIMASALRYGIIAILLGAVVASAMLGTRVGVAILAVVLAWNLWRLHAVRGGVRSDLIVHPLPVAIALLLGVVATGALVLAGRNEAPRVPKLSAVTTGGIAAVLALVSIAAVFVTLHRIDRGRTETPLERALLAYGPRQAAVVLGVGDLRAVLGPELDRHLIDVSRAGRAHEIPFADANQMRRVELGDTAAPPEPASFTTGLNAAILGAHTTLLVVGFANPVAYPQGWKPTAAWCHVFADDEGEVYVSALSQPGGTCP